ncbi:MAG: PilZ domain-containing protein [bacterium]|nr:PilZ domain-containing protein [bacterium]
MNDEPTGPGEPAEAGPPEGERRHADRVRIEGYEFQTAGATFEVVNLSIGGIRLSYGDGAPPYSVSQSVEGTLRGGSVAPISLTVEVVWIDQASRAIGCTFPVMGRNIAAQLLEILI